MSDISKAGNGLGYFYVTRPDGTSIAYNIANSGAGLRQVKTLAIQAAATSANLIASGTVTITAVSGTGNVTNVLVNSVGQMASSVSVTGLSIAQTATAIANEINSTVAASGIDYTSIADDDTVYLFAGVTDGSTPNGHAVAFNTDDPDNVTATTTAVAGGADANEIYDEGHGFRFFLNGTASAVEGDLTSSTEVTSDIITNISTLKTESVEIVSGALTLTRKGQETSIEVDTEGSAASDALATINAAGFTEGDTIYLRGQNAARVVTVNETGNIDLAGGTTFVTGSYALVITLQLWAKGGAGGTVLTWFETARSTQSVASIADFRADSIPIVSTEGETTIAAAASGTTTLTVNVSDRVQAVTGSATLSGDFVITFSTTGAVAGDTFIVAYAAQITEAANKVRIGGASKIALSTQQALIGGWYFWGYYDGSAWQTAAWPDMGSVLFKLAPEFLLDNGITPAKLTAETRTEIVTVPISFATGAIGDHKIEMPYTGTVTKIDAVVSTLIEATNDATITAKDDSAAVMATLTLTGGSSTGTTFTNSPSTNNTFVAGDILTFTAAKSTVGGTALISLKITRS